LVSVNNMQSPAEPSRDISDASTTAPARRSYDSSRRQAEAVERRRRVIDAAKELFLTVGYGASSITEIADAADVSPQMIYSSFGSKAGILAKLVDVVVAGDDAALRDEPGPLVRDRIADIEGLRAPDLRDRLRVIAQFASVSHGRSASVLQLIDSVAGSDGAVAALQAGLLAGIREDVELAVAAFPWDQVRPDLHRQVVSDLLYTLLGWRGFVSLVHESGWTPEQYEDRMAETLIHLLLPDRP
jgi:AcrR family transcriptional regulator